MLKYEVVSGIKPSFAEQKLAQALDKRNIVFAQEVTFADCINPQTGLHLRFDFYLPVQNILIEYDGIKSHEDVEVKRRDRIKNLFAKRNKIKLIRIQGIGNIEMLFIRRKYGLSDILPASTQPQGKQQEMRRFSRAERVQMCADNLMQLHKTSKRNFNAKIERMKRTDRNIFVDVLRILRANGMCQN